MVGKSIALPCFCLQPISRSWYGAVILSTEFMRAEEKYVSSVLGTALRVLLAPGGISRRAV